MDCHDVFSFTTFWHISCKELKFIVELEFLFFFLRENKLEFTFQFVHEMLKFILAGDLKGSFFKMFAQNFARGNSVQNGPDFPAKSLDAIFYMFNLKLVRENSKHETFVVFWKTIKYNTKLIDLFV